MKYCIAGMAQDKEKAMYSINQLHLIYFSEFAVISSLPY